MSAIYLVNKDYYYFRKFFIDVCLIFVCLLWTMQKLLNTDFHEIWWKCGTCAMEETTRLRW